MPAKNGFQRMTIDFTEEDHYKLKMLSTLMRKSMHSIIVESVLEKMSSFKELKAIEGLVSQNTKK